MTKLDEKNDTPIVKVRYINDASANLSSLCLYGKSRKINYILIQEYIKLGQRVKNFNVEIQKELPGYK
jgi:hypothetical protein